jgi:lipoyl(octanoyl) transferase
MAERAAAQLDVLRPGERWHDGSWLCPYPRALALMEQLIARPASEPDVLLIVEHPPTITLGRRGDRAHVHSTRFAPPGSTEAVEVPVLEIARGGDVTWHAPGQLVAYPIVQLPLQRAPIGRGPMGDLPAYARTLEAALDATCRRFGLQTRTREGFAGLWLDEHHKIASLGVAVRGGWAYHGVALNVCPHLEGFDLIKACGLDGVQMTSMWRVCDEQNLPRPSMDAVRDALVVELRARLGRRAEAAG